MVEVVLHNIWSQILQLSEEIVIESIKDISGRTSSGLEERALIVPQFCHSLAAWTLASNFPLWVSLCPSLNEEVNRITSGTHSSSDTIWRETDSCRKGRRMEDPGFREQETFLRPPIASPSSQMPKEKHLQRTHMIYRQLPCGFKSISHNSVSYESFASIMLPPTLPGSWGVEEIAKLNTMRPHQNHAHMQSPPNPSGQTALQTKIPPEASPTAPHPF